MREQSSAQCRRISSRGTPEVLAERREAVARLRRAVVKGGITQRMFGHPGRKEKQNGVTPVDAGGNKARRSFSFLRPPSFLRYHVGKRPLGIATRHFRVNT